MNTKGSQCGGNNAEVIPKRLAAREWEAAETNTDGHRPGMVTDEMPHRAMVVTTGKTNQRPPIPGS
jgi:hypothetical protein